MFKTLEVLRVKPTIRTNCRFRLAAADRVALEADEDGTPSADVLWRVAGAAGDREHPGRRSPRLCSFFFRGSRRSKKYRQSMRSSSFKLRELFSDVAFWTSWASAMPRLP